MDSHNRKELTMKRLTATLATITLVLAAGAPVASAKYLPGAKANSKAAAKQTVRPTKHMPAKHLAAKGIQVRLAKHMRGF